MKPTIASCCVCLVLCAALCASAKPPTSKSEVKRTRQTATKLHGITFPEVSFKQANLQDVIDVLSEMSLAGDTTGDKSGVNIVLAMAEGPSSKPAPDPNSDPFAVKQKARPDKKTTSPVPLVTFKARKISLYDTLKIVAQITGLKIRIEGSIVYLVPRDAPDAALEVRTYHVLPTIQQRMSELKPELRRGP